MADFPAPQSVSGAAVPVTAGVFAYALFGIGGVLEILRSGFGAPAPFLTIIGIVAVIVCYVKRADAAGTWVASHFTWLIRTFWWSLAWSIVGWAMLLLLWWVLGLGVLLAYVIWFVVGVWVVYRVVRGYLVFKDSQPMPGMI